MLLEAIDADSQRHIQRRRHLREVCNRVGPSVDPGHRLARAILYDLQVFSSSGGADDSRG